MRVTLAFAVIAIAFAMAYFRYREFEKASEQNRFLYELSDKLVKNNLGEMRSSFEVINSELKRTGVTEREFVCVAEFEQYLNDEFKSASDSGIIGALMIAYLKSGAEELDKTAEKLENACEIALECAEKKLIQYGKGAFVLYPALAAMGILILM